MSPTFQLMVIVLVSSCSFIPTTYGQLPSYMTACKRNDPKLNDCVLKVAKASAYRFSKGDPARGFIRLEPMKIKEIKTAAFGNKERGINFHFKNVVIKGLRDVDIKKFTIDLKKNAYQADAKANLTLNSDYNLKGRLLLFPLIGNGKARINIYNIKIKFYLNQGFTTKNGVKYPTVLNTDIKYDIQFAKIHLDGLFNGDKVLGETTNKLLNDNWVDVAAEIAPSIVNAIRIELTKMAERFFDQVPYDQLFIP